MRELWQYDALLDRIIQQIDNVQILSPHGISTNITILNRTMIVLLKLHLDYNNYCPPIYTMVGPLLTLIHLEHQREISRDVFQSRASRGKLKKVCIEYGIWYTTSSASNSTVSFDWLSTVILMAHS